MYKIKNANKEEERIINEIIKYIADNYSDRLSLNELEEIEVVNELPNDSSGRAIRKKMLLARKNGLELLKSNEIKEKDFLKDEILRDVTSTIYHELWHISTWDKYQYMYEYVLDKTTDEITASAYRYWIEYIAQKETVFMEVTRIIEEFCDRFVKEKWHEIEDGYSYFVYYLPYYIVRTHYLGTFNKLTSKIESEKLQEVILKFDRISKRLLDNASLDDIQKANVIKDELKELLK